jgi:hypothetical protein
MNKIISAVKKESSRRKLTEKLEVHKILCTSSAKNLKFPE